MNSMDYKFQGLRFDIFKFGFRNIAIGYLSKSSFFGAVETLDSDWYKHNWTLFVDQCQLQMLQFLVNLINLLSILSRCNGFSGIQKAIGDQMGSRPSNSDHDLFWGASLALGSALEHLLRPVTELVIASCHIKSTFHCTSQSNQEMVRCVE